LIVPISREDRQDLRTAQSKSCKSCNLRHADSRSHGEQRTRRQGENIVHPARWHSTAWTAEVRHEDILAALDQALITSGFRIDEGGNNIHASICPKRSIRGGRLLVKCQTCRDVGKTKASNACGLRSGATNPYCEPQPIAAKAQENFNSFCLRSRF